MIKVLTRLGHGGPLYTEATFKVANTRNFLKAFKVYWSAVDEDRGVGGYSHYILVNDKYLEMLDIWYFEGNPTLKSAKRLLQDYPPLEAIPHE